MDRLKTDINGGYPLELDDLRWIADGIDQAFFGIGTGFSDGTEGNSFLLSGGVVTINVGNLDVTAGYAWYKGEIVKIDAHSVLDGGVLKQHFWKLVVTFDPTGDETFEDLSGNSTYQQHRLELTQEDLDGVPGDPFSFNRPGLSTQRLSDILADPADIITNANDIVALNATLTGIFQAWTNRAFDSGDFTLGGTATYTITSGSLRFKRNGVTVHAIFAYTLNVTGGGTVLLGAPTPEDLDWDGGFAFHDVARALQPGTIIPEACSMQIINGADTLDLFLFDPTTAVATGTMVFEGSYTIELNP